MTELLARLRARAVEPVDLASIAALRVLLGLLLFGSICRFAWNGWIDVQLVQPAHALKYFGFEWVPVTPAPWIYGEFALLAMAALAVAAGLFYRWSIIVLLLGFLHVQLSDATNYLNHYYFVALLLVLLAVLPAGRAFSVDVWRRPELALERVPAWMTWILRFQVGLVYCGAALAKVGSDWLLHGQPLGIWLRTHEDLPIVGPWVGEAWLAIGMSWAGFLYDATIVGFLLSRRTRPWAYAVILVFHACTHALFDIGIFPFVMPIATLVFFEPSWPRRLLGLAPAGQRTFVVRGAPLVRFAAIAWCVVHVVLPLRHLAYPGDVLWEEQGMRFSWRVMVREKSGSVTFHVRDPQGDRAWQVNPARLLTPRQVREMATQPDEILQVARLVAHTEEARIGRPVEVRAEAWVSLNGRAPALLVDPTVDLARVEDGVWPASWVRPRPAGPPAPAGVVAVARGGETP